MPASNQQLDEAIASALQFCDNGGSGDQSCTPLVTRLSREQGMEGNELLRQETWPMLAYSSEIGDEIAQSPDAVHYAQLFGIVTTSKMQSSATSAAFARCAHPTQSGTTHTDPQILFSVMRS
jgi:hypothetical protein